MVEVSAWAAPRVAWYTVFVLALTVMFAQLDVTIMSLLVQPIKTDLRLSELEVSVLLGAAFAIFYTFIGLPAARFVEGLAARNRDDAPLRVVVIARSLGVPAAILAPLMPNPWLAVTLEGIATLAVGMGVGPTVVASITQLVLQSEAMLRYALVATSAIVGPLSLLIIWLGIKPYVREVAHLRGA